jgi:hypothetical protein
MTRAFLSLLLTCAVCQAADSSLKLHLSFNGDFSSGQVSDLSGNGGHGWRMNPTNWITRAAGVRSGTAALFTTNAIMCDGTSDGQVWTNHPTGWPSNPPEGVHFYPASQYIAVTNFAAFQYLTNGTISLWAQFYNKQLQAVSSLLDCSYNPTYAAGGVAASTNCWNLGRMMVTGLHVSMVVYPAPDTSVTTINWPVDSVNGDNDLSTATLNMYTVTFACGSSNWISYYNGLPYQTNSTVNIPWIRVYNYLCIGAFGHDGSPGWGDDRYPNDCYHYGKMADIRIYNRSLSAAEIQTLYADTDAGAVPQRFWWASP